MNAPTKNVFFSGETEARAVLAAANHFGVSPDQVVFDRVEKRHGFVKRRRVVIRVDPREVGPGSEAREASDEATDNRDGERPADAAPADSDEALADVAEDAPAPDTVAPDMVAPEDVDSPAVDSEEILEIAQQALRQLLELADLEVSAEMALADGRLEVEIEGVDQELLVEDEGQVLLALQHLLPRVMFRELGRIVPCRLDSGGYQRRKEERLRGLARRVADEVVSRGGIRTLRPMNPADRRIVHLTLADDPDVETESQGNGYFKRVNIRSL
ncbi:MAG: hypothetical protein OXG83_16225 [Acidobacteria bacterium]|nr:hypothetical protein [Acidobacteriota bacterium]